MTSEADVPGARVSAPGRVVVVCAQAGTLSSAASAKIAVYLMTVSFLVNGQRHLAVAGTGSVAKAMPAHTQPPVRSGATSM
ncbi:hypothetical protein CBM2634_B160161 [Cupriavidus taiwanensis]|uniref:Uncharacterized protein n=1 Tax=Cupriavidus taiwanensis TaxID=164546 RepID=A0A375J526_9BURK|nr:hypothetical protein CBM2634_B160161 [Cupriavidus taiwanensis]